MTKTTRTGSRTAATHPDPTDTMDNTKDERSIREIWTTIDEKLDKLTEISPPPKKHRRIIRLDAAARDALDVAMEDLDRPFTIQNLMDAMNELDSGCVTKGGDQCDSLRAYLLERCGLRVRYSKR